MTTERQILTDAHGKPTHVVLTVEAFQDMEELIEDLQEFQEFYQTRDKEKMIPWEEAKQRLGQRSSVSRGEASVCT